jgi:hypothetical protein
MLWEHTASMPRPLPWSAGKDEVGDAKRRMDLYGTEATTGRQRTNCGPNAPRVNGPPGPAPVAHW